MYTIKIDAFEGPFDLLFHLIDKDKIDIYDIPINEVTDQYLTYIYTMEKLDLDIASEFLVMAARLIEIKSKMLLPKDNLSDESEEDDILDPRQDLVNRLLEYKKYKAVTKVLRERKEIHDKVFHKNQEEIFIWDDEDINQIPLNIKDLLNAFNKLLKESNQRKENLVHPSMEIQSKPLKVEDKIKDILSILKKQHKTNFVDIFTPQSSRLDIIATFLALLELMKLNKVRVYQKKCFKSITIRLVT